MTQIYPANLPDKSIPRYLKFEPAFGAVESERDNTNKLDAKIGKFLFPLQKVHPGSSGRFHGIDGRAGFAAAHDRRF